MGPTAKLVNLTGRWLINLVKLSIHLLQEIVAYLWVAAEDFAQLSFILLNIALLIVTISWLRSLQTSYGLSRTKSPSLTADDSEFPKRDVNITAGVQSRSPRRGPDIKEISWIERIYLRLKSESSAVRAVCSNCLNNENIQQVHRQLPWSYTRDDVETVHWFNQTLRTLWPSIRTLFNKIFFNELLMPIKSKQIAKECKKLAKRKAKLSVYISCRRNLDLLRKIRAQASETKWSQVGRSFVVIAVYLIREFSIRLRQFVMDVVAAMMKCLTDNPAPNREVHPKEYTSRKLDETKMSWSTFVPAAMDTIKRVHRTKKIKFKSAPGNLAQFRNRKMMTGAIEMPGTVSASKFIQKRLKLAKIFAVAHQEVGKKSIKFDRIRLGDSIPTVEGIKFIDKLNEPFPLMNKVSKQMAIGEEDNMRFMVELSYESDERFMIKMSSIPLIDGFKLEKLNFRVRALITINHTTSQLNHNSSILDTPGDVLFPFINYVQIALVDLPQIDWKLKSLVKSTSNPRRSMQTRTKWNRVMSYFESFFDLFRIANHAYFKYLAHLMLYLSLKWFQPFDIKVGPNLYLRSIC